MLVIDTHAHFVPQTFPARPAGVPAHEWPKMVPLEDGGSRMMFGDEEFRVFEPAYWDVPGRLKHMNREGIAVQVLSPLPELHGYWFTAASSAAIGEHIHRAIAAAVASAPTRLVGLGMLPLQDVDLSVATVARLKQLGLRGVLAGSNINGISLADARFYPVFAELERHAMPLFVHGYRPGGTDRFIGTPMLVPIIGVPQEAMAVISSFIMTDILGHFPNLKLGFVHGGGALGAALDRLDHVWRAFPHLQKLVAMPPRDYVRRFFFDTVTYGVEYLRYLIQAYGADTLMAGTDGPTLLGQRELADFVRQASDGDTTVAEKISWRNAVRFFGLEDVIASHDALAAA